jgi:superfamily II DNA or RNA helicase
VPAGPLPAGPRITLLEQARDRLESRLAETCDIEQGWRYAGQLSDDQWMDGRVIVGSRDSLLSRNRYRARIYERTTLVLVDECHDGNTPRLEAMLREFEDRGCTIVGLSATPYKGKGKALRYWPRPQVVYSLADGIADGYLVGPKCFLYEAKSFDLSKVEEVAGEWNSKLLADILAAEHFAQEVVGMVLQTYADQPSVVYAATLRQASLLAEVFERYDAKVSLIHSRQNPIERQENMDAFLAGEARIIVNVGILGYGWDHPELRNIYMAAPTRSLSRYEQRLGRGTRLLPGTISPEMSKEERLAAIAASAKPHFNIYDITDASRSHQLLSALEVLDAKTRKSRKRRERVREALSMEGKSAEQVIRAIDDAERAEREALAAEMRERRRRLTVGVTFDSETRDLFSEPEGKRRRGWRMLYGKYKGVSLHDIPASYLNWVLESTKKDSPFKQAVRREVTRRRSDKQTA